MLTGDKNESSFIPCLTPILSWDEKLATLSFCHGSSFGSEGLYAQSREARVVAQTIWVMAGDPANA